jgi:hypothetical protein
VKRSARKRAEQRVALYTCATACAAWQEVVLPWFRSANAAAWEQRKPSLVVVPYRSHAYELKALLLDAGVPLLGVHFVVPAQVRDLLSASTDTQLPLREHLRLLLSVSAENRMDEIETTAGDKSLSDDAEALTAKSVARAPDHLLRALDQLSAGGWDFAEVGPSSLRRVATAFEQQVKQCGFKLIYNADREAIHRAEAAQPSFGDLLVSGFNGAHWPLWPLLHATVAAAAKATVLLDDPRDEARDLDESWVGTWEEQFGEAQIVGGEVIAGPQFVGSQATFDFDGGSAAARRAPTELHFLVGDNTTEQAQAIVTMAATFLSGGDASRIGILFSAPGALARTVAALLTTRGISHNDGIAHLAPGPFEEPAWPAWLELQQNPQLNVLLRFLRAFDGAQELFNGLPIERVEDVLRRAYGDVVIDDLTVLANYCGRRTDRADWSGVAAGIASLRFLPERATFVDFLSQTRDIFAQLQWTERWEHVAGLSTGWSGAVDGVFSRAIYLRWLNEITSSLYAVRDPAGDHPYSRVHLLPFPEAEGQQWSHLILAGLNEGNWPPADAESGFLAEEDIESLNSRVRALNKRAVRQGSQGEGHSTVREGKTVCLGPAEQRQLAARQLANLIDVASGGVAVSASLFREAEPERRWNPSEFFMQLYFGSRRRALSHRAMEALASETRRWIRETALFADDGEQISADVQKTRVAYDARRNATEPAGEYDFALREPIDRAVLLRVTQWEKVVSTPALIWMKVFLGVEGGAETGNAWSSATGQWVHRWLASITGEPASNRFAKLADPEQIRRRVREAALRFRGEVEAICDASHRMLPDWWRSGWSNALFLADCLAGKLSETSDWPTAATEWRLDSAQTVSLGQNRRLRFTGRIDLILARGETSESNFEGRDVWLIDYKTSYSKDALASRRWNTDAARSEGVRKKLLSGDAVQLGLYALAANELGAADVQFGILSPLVGLDRPQLRISDITAQEDFWIELHRMQETGIFGMLGPLRSPWSFANAYPLATIGIDHDVLTEKWIRTHPSFGEPPEEDDE